MTTPRTEHLVLPGVLTAGQAAATAQRYVSTPSRNAAEGTDRSTTDSRSSRNPS